MFNIYGLDMSVCHDDEEEQLWLEFDDPDFAVPVEFPKSENGLTCHSCQEYYPYAERPNQPDGTFKCWGCRNF
jgi:hypothetical protein